MFSFQPHGTVPAASFQVPPVQSQHSWPVAVNIYQVYQPVPRDQAKHPGREYSLLCAKECVLPLSSLFVCLCLIVHMSGLDC